MKVSATEGNLCSEQEEHLDVGESTQAGLGLESPRVQGQTDVVKDSIQDASGAALPQSTPTNPGLESCSFWDAKEGAILGISGLTLRPTQAGLGLESHGLQEQPNVEKVAIEVNSEAAVQLMQAGSRLELHHFQKQPTVPERAIQPKHGVVSQPVQADLGLEPCSSQVQPNSEESKVLIQPIHEAHSVTSNILAEQKIDIMEEILQSIFTRRMNLKSDDHKNNLKNDGHMNNLRNSSTIFDEEDIVIIAEILQTISDPMNNLRKVGHTNNLRNTRRVSSLGNTSTIFDKERNDTIEGITQNIARRMRSLRDTSRVGQNNICRMNSLSSVQVGPSHREEVSDLRKGQAETSHQEEKDGAISRFVLQAPPLETDNLTNDDWVAPPHQGTALHRMRLQVRLCGAELPAEPRRTCMRGVVSLEEAEPLPTELADVLCEDANCSSAKVIMQAEGDTILPLCMEGPIACVTESDYLNVAQQASRDLSGSSSTSLVHLLLVFLRDACILLAFVAQFLMRWMVLKMASIAACIF